MKIKKEVEMNEKELIKYLVDHDNTTIHFSGISYDGAWLSIEPEIESKVYFEFKDASTFEKTFTVEVEETVTEDTVIDEMLLVYDNGVTHIAQNKNLSFISKGNLKSAYYMNDDLRLILIWRDGKLIEE